MAMLEIETRKLQNNIDSLRAHLSGMHRSSDKMMADINALSNMWEGEAKNTFTEQFRSDYETLNCMMKIIEGLITKLEDARGKYDACENNVASIINGIRI